MGAPRIVQDAIEMALECMMALALLDLVLFHDEKPAKLKKDMANAEEESL